MSTPLSRRLAAGLAATCLAGGVVALALPGASASPSEDPAPAPAPASGPAEPAKEPAKAPAKEHEPDAPAPDAGVARMSSPYIPGVPHVPADVALVLGPGGSADGARFVGPEGSLFNGPVAEVEARVDAWWAEQMAAGLTPEEADALLAAP